MLFALLVNTVAITAEPGQSTHLERSVRYLMNYVSSSGLTFIRNGDPHTASEAAEHMGKKYEHFKSEIKTPEDFIALCASNSLMTGKPYQVIDEKGKKMTTADWLRNVLAAYRAPSSAAGAENGSLSRPSPEDRRN